MYEHFMLVDTYRDKKIKEKEYKFNNYNNIIW